MATITLMDDDDLVNAGDEDDIIYAGGGNDTVNAGGGNDTLMGDTGDDLLAGGAGDDQLLGDAGSDRLYGGEGNDVLDGGTTFWTEDFLAGGPGDETYVIEWNRDAVVEAPSEGVDLIRAAAGNYFFGAYTLPDGVENLDAAQVSGTTVRGNALDNVIAGSSGNDQLYGLSGSDHLIGGGGGDTLLGDGEGSDRGQVQLYNVGLGVGGMLIVGEQPTASVSGAGNSVAGLGDVNGDGHADIAVGASGAVYVLFGPFGESGPVSLADAAAGVGGYKIVSSGNEYPYGPITSVGDVNGDGRADLLIGAYGNNEGGGSYAGAAYVVFGKADGAQVSLAEVAAGVGGFKIVGEYGSDAYNNSYYNGDWAGYSVSAAGDINADGKDDVLIGARWNDEGGPNAGAAYVVWGKADGAKVNLDDVAAGTGGYKIMGENGNTRDPTAADAAGESVAGVGDVNGDGIPDLLIGAPGHAASYLVYGKADNGKINLDDVAQEIGGFKISGAGSSVASGGDVNGDGRTDYLIGGSGVSYVVFGSATPGNVSLTEVGAGNGGYALNFGGSPVSIGDINGDGRADQLAMNFSNSGGWSSGVVFGKASGVPVNAGEVLAGLGGFAIFNEGQFYSGMSAAAGVGDVDGDGVGDILIGQTNYYPPTGGPSTIGAAYLVFGAQAAHARGDDLIEGRAGDDWLVGGGGSDKLDGGIGTDTADYSGSAGAVMANLGVGMATQDGLGGADTLVDMENLNGSAHADKLVGSALANALYGQSGDDELWAGAGADLLDGGAGDDVLGSGAGVDTLTGGAGADHFVLLPGMEGETITDFVRGEDRIDVAGFGAVVADWAALRARIAYASGDARIDLGNSDVLTVKGMAVDSLTEADFVGLGALGERWSGAVGDDQHTGTVFDDVLDGLAGDDTLAGAEGDDVLAGDAGDDLLEGDIGNDRLEGNAGTDTLDGGPGTDTADYSHAMGSVEVDLSAGMAEDDGNLGRDTLIDIENVIGSSRPDYLIGDEGPNRLSGLAGNDVLKGLGGNDVLEGGPDNNRLEGGVGEDTLLGGSSGDSLYGGEGNDVLDGGTTFWTEDFLAGGPGDDTYVIEWNRDAVVEAPSEGVDLIRAAAGNYFFGAYTLPDGVENLDAGQVSGTTVRGNALDNVITGSSGNDQLYGLSGSDHLIGGGGSDTLLGDGEGSDSGQVSLYDVGRGVGGVRINGEKANDYAGSSLTGLGDVNGDGHADIAVGASSAVYVLFGPFGNNWQINLNDAAAGIGGYKIVASGSEYIYGSITSAGDVNGDGLGDLLIANYNDPEGGGGYSGAAFVVFGKADGGQIDLAQVAAGNGGFKIVGEYGNQYGYYYGDWAGYSLSAAGDLNADGNDDVLIGARWNDEGGYQAGAAYVVWGKADGLKVNLDDVANGVGGYKIVGENGDRQRSDGPGDAAGESVAGVGDVNGDAIPDLLIGAPGHAASYLVYGKADNGKINLDDVAQGIGGFKISGAGSSVASGGDVNGDGRTDYLIGGSGVSYVVFGSATPGNVLLTEVGAGNGGYALNFGGSPVNLGDINGDGRGDLLVTNFTSQQSSIYHSGVVFGRAGGTPVNAAEILAGIGGFAIGIEQYVSFSATAAPGDVTGDGVPDLLAGSTYNDNNRGYAYLIDGHAAAHVRGDDLIEGGAGDDWLVGGGGSDKLDGGIGTDTADYSGSAGAVMANLGVGMATQDGLGGTDTLVDMENLNGSAHADKLLGSALANALYGQNGDDELWAGAGADLLDGGAGNDVLGSDAGADTLTGGAGADCFVLLPGMEGETITDFVRGQDRIDVAGFGALVADWAALRARVSYVSGEARIDFGNGDLLTIKGMPVDGLTEADFVGLGALGERWVGSTGDDGYSGTPFDDVLDGLAGNDTVNAGGGDDVLTGDTGDDRLEGGAGDDRLEGNGGNDTLDGAAGIDTADYSRALGSVGVDLGAGLAADDGNLGSDTLIDIENVIGSPYADRLVGNDVSNGLLGSFGNDVLIGLGGNDVLDGASGNDTLYGGAGDDRLIGGAANEDDYLYGGEGNDTLEDFGTPWLRGNTLAGGPGDDTYIVGDATWGGIVELPNEGDDHIIADLASADYIAFSSVLQDNVERLSITKPGMARGNALDNVITGSTGNDRLIGLAGTDHLIGGAGNDTLLGDGEGADSGQVSLYDVGRGVGGVRINGEKANDYAGSSLAGLGDVNGDGHADIAVGASGAAYVLFGPFGNDWQINLNDAAAGIGGYRIVASGSEYIYGSIASAGDVNGDGLADLLIANYNDPEGGGGYSGAAFVVFGKADGGQIDLAQVAAGNGGFKIVGEYGNQYGYYYGDWAGYSLSAAGDLNADGNDDVLIGARWNDEGGYQAGAAYVVWGKADGLKVNLDDVANGVGGYKIVGENGDRQRSDGPGDAAGESVAGVGDVNGDGVPDMLIGAPGHAASYLVYGKADNGKINLDDVALGIGGFKISGAGSSVASGGDVNGDGRSDYLIGASGTSYVVFGSANPGHVSLTDVAAGNGGYRLDFGGAPIRAGDLNGDGRDDQLVLNFNYPRSMLSGVVYGKGSGVPVGVGDLTGGTAGFAVANEYSEWMRAMAPAGDVDADGIPDFLVSTAGPSNVGVTYVVLGKDAAHVRGDDLIEGGAGDDALIGGGGNDTLIGGPGNDYLRGGDGDDALDPGIDGDVLDGGTGTDQLILDWSSFGVTGSGDGIAMEAYDASGAPTEDPALAVEWSIQQGATTVNLVTARGMEEFNLTGTAADDVLRGTVLADTLKGGAGDDVLDGHAGADRLTGGEGADTFRGTLAELDGDTISDLGTLDALLVSGDRLTANQVAFSNGALRIDTNGDGVSEAEIGLDGSFYGRFEVTTSDPADAAATTVRYVTEPPVISIKALDDEKAEGESGVTPFTFEVTRSGDLNGTSSVDYAVSGWGDNPSDWRDFNGSVIGTITFSAGESSRMLTVSVASDDAPGLRESFAVQLSNATNATFAIPSAMASVYEPPFLTKANLTATELTMVNGFIHSAYGQPIPGGYRLLGHTDLPTIPAGRFDAQGFFVGDPIPNTPLAQDPQRCLPVISNNGMEIILVHPGGKVASDAHTHGELYQGESLLISAIRTYVQLQYPTASPDLWIVGHSRGGSTVNEIFTQEKNRAGPTDIFDQARYIAFAPGNVQGNSVLLREIANIGFENDYVFKRLQGGINDESDPKRLPENTSTTDNLVFFWEDYTDSRSGWGRDANSMRAHALDASDLFVEVATDPLYTQYIFEDSAVLLNHDASKTYDFRHITSSHYGSSVTIFGRAAKDEIIGSAYGDNLFGRSGDDTIIGLGGIDNIFGGSGSDSLSGGPDQDRFIGTQSELNGDTIKDFWSEDVIRFDGARFSSRELNYQVGSLLIDSDTNGTFETTIKLGADLSPGKFVATQSSPGEPVHTLITYEASDALVWIVPPSVSYYEGDVGSVTEYVYTVIRSGDLEKPSIVHCTIAPDGADGADPDDFEGGVFPKSRELIFQRDETSKDLRIRVQGDDQKNENDEGFKITLSPITNATVVGDKKEAIGVIQDDDTYPRLTISDATAMEDDGKIVFSISRSGDLKYDSAVNWRVEFEAGQADGTDLGNVLHGTAFFKSGNASPEVPLEIDIVDDSLKEPNETFKVFLDKPLQLVVKDPEAQGTIKDDDSPKQVSIKAVDAEKAEGTDISAPPRATPFTFEVWRAGTSDEAFSVRYTVTGAGVSAADVTTDLMGLTTDTLDFAEKEPSKTITIEVVPDDRDEDDEGFVVTLSQATNGFEIDQETARGLIQNDDDLEFSIAPDGGSSQQEGNAGTTYFTFTVSRGGNAHAGDIECSVDYAVALGPKGGVWADSNDFDGKIIGTVMFAADGVLSKTISIPVKGDADPELDERFYVQLTNPGRKAAGAAATPVIGTDKALGTIGDDDSRKLSIVSEVSKSEGTDTTAPVQWTEMQFTVTRTNTQGPVEVSYGVTPGPTLPADDQDVQGLSYTDKLNFADGQGSAVITVKVNPDGNIEPNETFFVTLGDLAGWTFSNRQSVGTIEDDDAQKVSIVSSVSRAEGSNGGTTPFRFEVTRSNTHGVLELSYGVTGGPQSPADGSDIANMGIGKLKFEDGEGKQWIVVDINRDNDEERNETFFVTLGDPGTGLKFGNRQAVGTIGNDDIPLPPWPRPVFRGDPHLTTLDGLAYDFQAVGEFVAMQSPNGQDVLVQVRTAPVGDLASNITAVAMLLDGHRVTLTAGEAATLRIDGVQTEIPLSQGFIAVGGGTVTFDGDAYTVIDPDGAGMHVQSFPGRIDLTLTVGAAFSGNLQGLLGNFNGVPADDFVLPDGTVLSQPVAFADLHGRFADSWRVTMATSLFDYGPGESSATFTDHSFPRQAVTLDMLPPAIVARATTLVDEAGIADPTARAAAILDLALTGDMSYLRSASVPVPVTQVAQVVNVPAPLPSLSIIGPEGVQWEGDTGGTHIRFDVFRSGDTAGALPVVYEVVPFGTHPADADDFGGTWPTGLLEFADGEGAKPIEIVLSGDTLAEYSEGFAVRLSVSSEDRGRVLLAASSARVTIENDDGDVPARFDIEPVVASAAEGDAGSVELTFSVTRSDNLATEALVSYAVLGYGRAASADDFDGGSYPAGTLAFLPNETHKVISITVAPDTDVEFDESFVVWLANPINGVVGAAAAAGSILNDDVPPAPALAIVAIDAYRPEGNGDTAPFSFVVTRTGDLTGTSTVAYVVTGSGSSSASADDFGGALPSGTISFAANEASKTVTVDVRGDTTVEPNEGFTVTLSDPGNATISTATAGGTILNDDAPPPPTLAIATVGASKPEGDSGTTLFTFAVTRSGDTSGVTNVDYSVAGAGVQPVDAADFGGALPSGTLTFAAGEVEQVITIAVTGDTAVEVDEQFAVDLTNPANATLAVASASATIENDDVLALPTVSIAAEQARLAEGNSGTTAFSFLLTRSGDLSGETSVSYSLSAAADASDFIGGVLPSGLVVFASGSSEQRLTIEVAGDGQIEPHEAYTVVLHDPVNATVGNGSAVATIINDDTSSFKIGDAPARPPRSDAGAWERSWSHAGVSIAHKANLADANESYSNVLFSSSGSGILAGGDVSGGDLGVSGQTLATSAVLQELDGSEGLRFVLDEEANQISFQLSRFTRDDDGTGFNEAGRLQLLDAAGVLVKEIFFYADALDGSKQLSVSVEEGFSQAVFSAGAQNGEDFVYGAYGNEAGNGFGSDPYSANGGMHGSEYLIDSVGFTTGYVDLLWAG